MDVLGGWRQRHRPDAAGARGSQHPGVGLEPTEPGLPPPELDGRSHAAGPVDRHDPVVVDVVVAELSDADRRADPRRLGIAQQEPGGVDRVDAHVDQCATPGERRIGEPTRRPPPRVHTPAVGPHDPPELPGGDAVAERDHVGVVAPHVADGERALRPLRGGDHPVGVGDRGGHRLLDEDVLAVVEGMDRLLRVQRVRRADDHEVDVGFGTQARPVLGHAVDAPPACELGRRIEPVPRHADDLDVGQARGGLDVHRADEAVAEHDGPQWIVGDHVADPVPQTRGSVDAKSNAALASSAVRSRMSATPTSRSS